MYKDGDPVKEDFKGRTCSTHVDDDVQKILYGLNEGKCSLERPKRRWEYIRMDIVKKQDMSMWTGFI